jgi:hypothetical protein
VPECAACACTGLPIGRCFATSSTIVERRLSALTRRTCRPSLWRSDNASHSSLLLRFFTTTHGISLIVGAGVWRARCCQARWNGRAAGDDEEHQHELDDGVHAMNDDQQHPASRPWFASVTSIGGYVSLKARPAEPATVQIVVADVRSWSRNHVVAITAGMGECERSRWRTQSARQGSTRRWAAHQARSPDRRPAS